MNEIQLVQQPIIKHALVEVGKSVTQRLADLNIDGQVATVDTVKSLKDLRAELNKELAAYEEQRKAIKNGVLNPYNDFETIYKTEISEKFKTAIDTLKDKIAEVEDKIKADKRDSIMEYFSELCLSENIDFLTFGSVSLEINLSTSEKQYKDRCNEFVCKVKEDLALIETQEYKAEILVEYRKSLNVSNAITTITTRKKAEAEERERLRLKEIQRRKMELAALDFMPDDMTNVFAYNDDIYMSNDDLENITNNEFEARRLEFEQQIKAILEANKPQPVAAPIQQKPVAAPAPAPAPKVEQKIETFIARFECTITRAQAQALKEFFTTNSITYKNI